MERFEVKRGLVKSMGGNAGLAKLATEHFNDVEVNADGVFIASFAILKSVTAEYTADGKLLVDVEQMKGQDLSDFLPLMAAGNKQWNLVLGGPTSLTKLQATLQSSVEIKQKSKQRNSQRLSLPLRWLTKQWK